MIYNRIIIIYIITTILKVLLNTFFRIRCYQYCGKFVYFKCTAKLVFMSVMRQSSSRGKSLYSVSF